MQAIDKGFKDCIVDGQLSVKRYNTAMFERKIRKYEREDCHRQDVVCFFMCTVPPSILTS